MDDVKTTRVTKVTRREESRPEFAARMAEKAQYGYSNSRNRVYLHRDDWQRILDILAEKAERA